MAVAFKFGHTMQQRRQSYLKSGVLWIRVKKIRFLQGNFREMSIFHAILKEIIFSGQISEKFRFLQAISQNISTFQAKIGHIQQLWENYSISLQKSPFSNILPVNNKT